MATVQELLSGVPDRLLLAALVVVLGFVVGYVTRRLSRRLLERAGVSEAVEGTSFERTARGMGSSTVAIVGALSMWFIVGVSVLIALSITDVRFTAQFWGGIAGFLPEFFLAVFVLLIGFVVGDMVELVVSERLRGIKLPQIGVLPKLARYSVIYVAILIALGQIGVATAALIVLLAVYLVALVFIAGIAFKDLLSSGAAGVYLLLTEPYGIGDRIEIGGNAGVVQEVTVFVTRIEDDGAEYIVPNRRVFERGVVRTRRE